jgi:hypothetical protein
MPAMCEDRERLISYLYDACGAHERREIEAHLDVCEECRDEIGGLQAVRQDLLAWDVPDHGSVWKPFVPVQASPWWRGVPVWALAAAASLTFTIGLAGGLVARALTTPRAASVSVAQAQPVSPPPVTRAEMAAMEQRILGTVQAQIDQRLVPVPAHVLTPATMVNRDDILKQVEALLAASEQRQQQALGASMRTLLQDSERTFVRKANFKTELQTFRWDIAQALQQQGGRQ